MSEATFLKNRQLLSQLMQQVGIANVRELVEISGVCGWQVSRLQYGLMPKMHLDDLLKLSQALQIPLSELFTLFYPEAEKGDFCVSESSASIPPVTDSAELEAFKQEYSRLQQQLEQQQESLKQEFQQSSLEVLESWLLQWPTASAVAQKNPQLSAVKLLPLVKPMLDLLKSWGIESVTSVGEEVAYDPQWHQLMEGTAEPGDRVLVRYVGYRQGDKLLYRAKVSLLGNTK